MNDLEERLLRDFLSDLVAAKGAARKIITENIVKFVKKISAKQSEQLTNEQSAAEIRRTEIEKELLKMYGE